MFCFMVFLGFCGLVDAHGESWDNVVLGRVIVCYDNSIDIHKASLEELGIANKGVSIVTESVGPLNFVVVQVPKDIEEMKEFIELMEKQPNVEYAEPDRWGEFVFTPNDQYYSSYQYDKPQMNCEGAWDYTLGDTSISIAVVDQGTQYTHPDLAAQYGTYKGYDYVDNDDDPICESTSELHGTHCSGIAAAVINNSIGIAGVANVRLYAYRCGSGTQLTVTAAVQSMQAAVARGANVISMSWGFSSSYLTLYNAVKLASDSGCFLCAASGNDGRPPIMYPAKYSEVVAVGNITSNNQLYGNSTYGPEQELVAGGYEILSTVPFNDYAQYSGTSMACPNIAGAAALVWSANISLTGQEVRAFLCSTAVDLGTAGRDQYYGYGKPNLLAAVLEAREDTSDQDIQVNPDTLRFEFSESKLATTILYPERSEETSQVEFSFISMAVEIPAEINERYEDNVVSFNKDGEDTIYYDDGTFAGGYQGQTNALYWAVKFTPTQSCEVKAGLVEMYTMAGTPPSNCSLLVWDDAGGQPGDVVAGPFTFATAGTGNWERIEVTTSYTDDNDFWLGYWLPWLNSPNPGDTTVALTDAVSDHGSGQGTSGDRSEWNINPGMADFMIRAIVTYGGTVADTVKTLVIKNVGGKDLNVTNISSGESWVVSSNPTNFTLTPMNEQDVTVTVSSAGLSNGTHSGTLQIDSNDPDENPYLEPMKFVVNRTGTEESEKSQITGDRLQVYPNPFGKKTIISYQVSAETEVSLKIHDISGRLTRSFPINDSQFTTHEVPWDGIDDYGKKVKNGIYFCKLQAGDYTITKKISLIR